MVSGTGESVNGYNVYSYCFNNPVNLTDPSGCWPEWMKKAANWFDNNIVKPVKETFSFFNHVDSQHFTTPSFVIDLGYFFGKAGISSTINERNKSPGLFHSCVDVGNDANRYSVGVNILNWLGLDIGVSNKLNLFANVQITPWVHTEVSIGLDGLGVVLGIDSKNVSYDLEVKGGWGLFALLFLPQVSVSGYGTGIPAY